jgi:hypothetical protein
VLHHALCLGAVFFVLSLLPSVHGDISIPSQRKSGNSEQKVVVSPTVLVRPVTAEVIRGGEVTIPIAVVLPNGGDPSIQISRHTRYGTLRSVENHAGSANCFLYLNDSSVNSSEDCFEFRIKAPGQAWSTHTAFIRIKNPPGLIAVIPGKIEFGSVPIGTTARRTLLLCNSFGSPVSGTLLLPQPWTLVGDGAFSLAENETRSFEILYTPVESKPESTELKVAPELSNFPAVPITGEGIVPFMIDTNSAIVSKEHPKADFRITNSSNRDMRIGWDEDTGLLCSPPALIPPHGTATVWVSIGSLPMENEERRVLHPSLRDGNFSFPLEIIALGPRGKVSLKTGEKTLSATADSPITLQGTIESTSSVARTLELHCSENDVKTGGSSRTITIPAHASQPFIFSWSSSTAGEKHVKVLLIEAGRVQDEAQWTVVVLPRESAPRLLPPVVPPAQKLISGKPSSPGGAFYRIPRKDNDCVAVKLTSYLKPGILANTLILHWLYLGGGVPTFIVEERTSRNALTDRTGDHADEPWRRLDLKSVPGNGGWATGLAMPWPGRHTYRVYPSGCPYVIMSQITVQVTWGMFLWPLIRMILGLLFLICLIKVLRERF